MWTHWGEEGRFLVLWSFFCFCFGPIYSLHLFCYIAFYLYDSNAVGGVLSRVQQDSKLWMMYFSLGFPSHLLSATSPSCWGQVRTHIHCYGCNGPHQTWVHIQSSHENFGSASKTHMKISGLPPKPTWKSWVCMQNPTALLDLPPQTKIRCLPLVEGDFFAAIGWALGRGAPPWWVQDLIDELIDLFQDQVFYFVHVLRSAN